MNRTILTAILLLSLPVAGLSQYKNQDKAPTISESLRIPTGYNGGSILNFLDFSNIQINHSYSFGFGSGGGRTNSYGLYMNQILYPVNDKIFLNLNLGYVHDPLQSFYTPSPSANQGRFVGGGEISYFPTENMAIRFSINNYQRYRANPYSRFRRY